jgi:plasmid stability protein
MATLNVPNFPDELYVRLQRRAAANHRAVADEVVEAAEKLLKQPRSTLNIEEKLRLADAVRSRTPGTGLTDEMIRRARDEGRS